MRNLLAIVFMLVLASTFSACGNATNEEPIDEQSETSTDTQLDSYVGGELTDLMNAVDDLEYEVTYYNQGEDWTDILPLDENWPEDFLVGALFEDPGAKTVKVILKYKSFAEQEETVAILSEKLKEEAAWVAIEEYGQDQYGDDFDLDYLIYEWANDENTWCIQAKCQINGNDTTCNAKVTGTTNDPEVVFFNIY